MTHVKYLMKEEVKEHRHDVFLNLLEQKKASISFDRSTFQESFS